MNYRTLYSRIINKALTRQLSEKFTPGQFYEDHHILPRSQGGSDHPSNLVLLTPKEHYTAHLLLWRMGDGNQIFAIECFINDSINPRRPHRFAQFRWKKWLRRAVAYQSATNLRQKGFEKLAKAIPRRVREIDNLYVDNFLTAAGMGETGDR